LGISKKPELHGSSWFWQKIGIKEREKAEAKDIFVPIMESGEC